MEDQKIKANKPNAAAALRYESGRNSAPVVVATGKGDLAAKIIELAKKENIPVYRDPVLARALVKLGAGAEIPEELYEVVAQLLVHVAGLDKKLGGQYRK